MSSGVITGREGRVGIAAEIDDIKSSVTHHSYDVTADSIITRHTEESSTVTYKHII